MTDKRMLIVPDRLVRRIDENRGDMSQSDFIDFLIDSQLEQDSKEQRYVTREALQEFEKGIKDLLRSFMEFFVSYGLELGKQTSSELEELSRKLEGESLGARKEGQTAKPG